MELDAPTEIDWGDLEIVDDINANVEIDWDNIDGIDRKDNLVDIVIEESGVEGGVARGAEALSILDNRKTRHLILDELHELEAFFSQRLAEIHTLERGKYSITGLSVNSDLVNDASSINEVLSNIRGLINNLTTGKIHHLQLIRSSPKYVDRLVDNLKQKMRFVDRCELKNVELAKKREVALKEQAEAQTKLKV